MKTALITPYTESSLCAVKIASLYFDEVELQQHTIIRVKRIIGSKGSTEEEYGIVRDIIKFVDDSYLKKIEPLLDEGIVKINDEPKLSEESYNLEKCLSDFLRNNDHLILKISKSSDLVKVETEVHDREIHEQLLGPLDKGSFFFPNVILNYYSALFSDAIRLSSDGLPVVSSSPALYKILQAASDKKVLQNLQFDNSINNIITPKFAFDVIEALMLDVGDLEIDDVLEARNKLSDELLAFRSEMSRLQFEFEHEFGSEKILKDGRSIAKARLLPKIKDLERKVEKGHHQILKNLFSILRKPDPYVPMLGTSFAGLPVELSLLISLGIVSVEMAIDTIKAKQDINKNSLFYLMKLRQKAKSSKQKESLQQSDRTTFNPDRLAIVFPWEVTDIIKK